MRPARSRVSSAGKATQSPTPVPHAVGARVPGLAPGQTAAGSPRRGRARRWRRAVPLAAVLAAVVAGTAGCTSNAFTRMGMPVPVTKQGQVALTLWQGSWAAAWAVGAVVWGLILWAIIFHRKRTDRPPHQVRYNLPIEMLYTVVPFIMIGVLFFFTARDENYINKVSASPDVVVNVVGYQWVAVPVPVPGAGSGPGTVTGAAGAGSAPGSCRSWGSRTMNRALNGLETSSTRS